MGVNILHNVGNVFSNLRACHFFVWITIVGMCTGLLWQFLFWHLEVLSETSDCTQSDYTKTLQGLASALRCFCGEVPFFFFSGMIIRKIGHINSMTLVLLGFGISYVLVSLLSNPWFILPIELLQGATLGLMYAVMPAYASEVAPSGTEATIQGLVGAMFEGVGTSLGSLVGGIMFGKYGGAFTFRMFGCVALVICLINIAMSFTYSKKPANHQTEEFSSIIRYAAPNEAIDLLND